MELSVSPAGNDNWSGKLSAPNKDKTDGPLASIAASRDRIRSLKDLAVNKDAKLNNHAPANTMVRCVADILGSLVWVS